MGNWDSIFHSPYNKFGICSHSQLHGLITDLTHSEQQVRYERALLGCAAKPLGKGNNGSQLTLDVACLIANKLLTIVRLDHRNAVFLEYLPCQGLHPAFLPSARRGRVHSEV